MQSKIAHETFDNIVIHNCVFSISVLRSETRIVDVPRFDFLHGLTTRYVTATSSLPKHYLHSLIGTCGPGYNIEWYEVDVVGPV
jgi:hypothetical protein